MSTLERWPYAQVEPLRGQHEALSMAISAKRQADALERIADALDARNGLGGSLLLRLLEQIAERS